MKTLVEFLTEYNESNDYGTEDGDLHESLIECFELVWEGNRDEHRWYDIYEAVYKVNIENVDRYFQTFYYETKGDGSAGDYGLEKPTASGAYEVYPRVVSRTIYSKEKVINV